MGRLVFTVAAPVGRLVLTGRLLFAMAVFVSRHFFAVVASSGKLVSAISIVVFIHLSIFIQRSFISPVFSAVALVTLHALKS